MPLDVAYLLKILSPFQQDIYYCMTRHLHLTEAKPDSTRQLSDEGGWGESIWEVALFAAGNGYNSESILFLIQTDW